MNDTPDWMEQAQKSLEDCLDDMVFWAEYASEYWQQKHDLEGDIKRHKAAIERLRKEIADD